MVSNAIGLDAQVYNKYYEAIKVLKENQAQSSWENHTDYYLRVEVGSDAYMQAQVSILAPYGRRTRADGSGRHAMTCSDVLEMVVGQVQR